MDPEWLLKLKMPILTPHPLEFKRLFGVEASVDNIKEMAQKYTCIILVKGEKDTICSPESCVEVDGGNAGMTKGGTGDVLAGLIAALATKNDPFLAATAGSYLNKRAGESLYKTVGLYFNASDLADEIPKVMKEEILV
jgi:NAD(P)H-hydrate epimerase